MKHNYTPEQMQAAIDAACNENVIPLVIHTVKGGAFWEDQKSHRLHLIRTALDLLPEPPPPAEIPWTEWHGGDCPLNDEARAAFGGASLEADKLQAEIAEAKAILQQVDLPDEPLVVQARRMVDQYEWQAGIARGYEKQIQQANETLRDQLSALRPISEAGEVTAGCVRFLGYKDEDGDWILANYKSENGNEDTHFADICLPVKPPTKKEMPCGFNSALDVTPDEQEPPQPWTPKVGDVVTLKSGGPTMTVSGIGCVEVQVHGFKGLSLVRSFLPITTLQPA